MTEPRGPLRSSADEFALLVEAVQDYAIFLLSPTGEIRSWNRGAARITGYSAEEIVGRRFSTFYTDEDLRNRKPDYELAMASSEGRVEDEGWRVRRDGNRFWANTVITALRNAEGELLGFAKVTRDLSERRSAEERLRQNEEFFRLLVESVRDYAIFMLDTEGNVASWNEGARRIKGYEAHEIIGRHFSTFYSEQDVREGKPARELVEARDRGSVEDEGWRLRKDGSRFWANVVITAVHDPVGNLRGYAKVTRDITERREAEKIQQSLLDQQTARLQAEQERNRAEASFSAAQEANRSKDEFLMTLSHELRTPMTAILGWARLLPTISREDPMFNEAVSSIARSAELQAQLIDDVLDVSRIVAGKLRLSPEVLEVKPLIREAAEGVRTMAAARSVSITTAVEPDAGEITADATRLQQVIWNLLTNAVKFTPAGGTVELNARRTQSDLKIIVRDSGEGIDPEFLPHMFEPFRQAENPRTRVHGGLGLGLSIVRHLVEAHGGGVRAESPGRGQGATFTVTLPFGTAVSEEVSDAPARPNTSLPAADQQRLAGIAVLVIDDDQEARALIRAVLLRAGAQVAVVESGSAALHHLDAHKPHVILTDIAMPETDGYELSRIVRARKENAGVKIVALSAFPPLESHEPSDFDLRLCKPIEPVELIEAIADICER